MQGEHNRTTSLRRIIIARISHNSQAIVSMNKRSQPTFSVTLPYFPTKSLCGLAVVHTLQLRLDDGRIPAVV